MRSNPSPKIVTWLSVAVLIFSAVQFVGVIAWFPLPDLPLTVPRSYLLVKNIFWGLVSLTAGTGLLFGQTWGYLLSRWGAVVFAVFQLFDLTVLRSSRFALAARTFNITATLGTIGLFLIFLTRPGVKDYFRRKAV